MSTSNDDETPPDTCPDLNKKARERPEDVTEEEWRTMLTPMQYSVARGHGTERPWTGKYNEEKGEGRN